MRHQWPQEQTTDDDALRADCATAQVVAGQGRGVPDAEESAHGDHEQRGKVKAGKDKAFATVSAVPPGNQRRTFAQVRSASVTRTERHRKLGTSIDRTMRRYMCTLSSVHGETDTAPTPPPPWRPRNAAVRPSGRVVPRGAHRQQRRGRAWVRGWPDARPGTAPPRRQPVAHGERGGPLMPAPCIMGWDHASENRPATGTRRTGAARGWGCGHEGRGDNGVRGDSLGHPGLPAPRYVLNRLHGRALYDDVAVQRADVLAACSPPDFTIRAGQPEAVGAGTRRSRRRSVRLGEHHRPRPVVAHLPAWCRCWKRHRLAGTGTGFPGQRAGLRRVVVRPTSWARFIAGQATEYAAWSTKA